MYSTFLNAIGFDDKSINGFFKKNLKVETITEFDELSERVGYYKFDKDIMIVKHDKKENINFVSDRCYPVIKSEEIKFKNIEVSNVSTYMNDEDIVCFASEEEERDEISFRATNSLDEIVNFSEMNYKDCTVSLTGVTTKCKVIFPNEYSIQNIRLHNENKTAEEIEQIKSSNTAIKLLNQDNQKNNEENNTVRRNRRREDKIANNHYKIPKYVRPDTRYDIVARYSLKQEIGFIPMANDVFTVIDNMFVPTAVCEYTIVGTIADFEICTNKFTGISFYKIDLKVNNIMIKVLVRHSTIDGYVSRGMRLFGNFSLIGTLYCSRPELA